MKMKELNIETLWRYGNEHFYIKRIGIVGDYLQSEYILKTYPIRTSVSIIHGKLVMLEMSFFGFAFRFGFGFHV